MSVAPVSLASRVGNFVLVGGTAEGNYSDREVKFTIIDHANGKTAADVWNIPRVREPINQGCLWTHFHNPYGASPNLYKYQFNGQLSTGTMHFHQRAQAAAAGLTWLEGWESTVSRLVQNYNQYVSGYFGRMMPKDDTTGPPWNWLTDISNQVGDAGRANMADLAYIRYQIGEFLDGGAAQIFSDASGYDLSPGDTSSVIAAMLAAPGVHAAAGYANTFINGYARAFGFEATPPKAYGAWKLAYSFIAVYDTFVNHLGDPTRYQPAEFATIPTVIFRNAAWVDFKDAKAILLAGYRSLVKWKPMADQGFPMQDLLDAASVNAPPPLITDPPFVPPPPNVGIPCDGKVVVSETLCGTGEVTVVSCCPDGGEGDDGGEPPFVHAAAFEETEADDFDPLNLFLPTPFEPHLIYMPVLVDPVGLDPQLFGFVDTWYDEDGDWSGEQSHVPDKSGGVTLGYSPSTFVALAIL